MVKSLVVGGTLASWTSGIGQVIVDKASAVPSERINRRSCAGAVRILCCVRWGDLATAHHPWHLLQEQENPFVISVVA